MTKRTFEYRVDANSYIQLPNEISHQHQNRFKTFMQTITQSHHDTEYRLRQSLTKGKTQGKIKSFFIDYLIYFLLDD